MQLQVKVGCCGYPVSKVKYYENFDVVEIQSTFYKLPKIETAIKWREEVPANFEFIVKAWQAITHPWGTPTWRRYGKTPPGKLENYGFLRYTEENIKAWNMTVEICKALKCSKVVIQLPPKLILSEDNIDEIKQFLGYTLKSGLRIIVEPRHQSWNNEEIKRFFKEKGIVHCVDPFKDKDWGTGDFHYYRLHGINGYNYSYKYTDDDLRYLVRIISSCEKDVYVMFNNKFMFVDAIRFKEIIK
mgnify:CR=1 FL=1